MPSWHTIAIDRGDVGVRIDRVLLRHLAHLPGVSRNRLQRLLAAGGVHINGRPVSRPSRRVGAHDEVRVALPERRLRAKPAAEPLPLEILHEDDALLVVNKPPGIVSHPAIRHATGTLLNALLAHAGDRWTPSLVGRLDQWTSGAVVVAKRKTVHTMLQRLSLEGGIEKDYLAVVAGKPPSRGRIDLGLDRDPWDRRRMMARDRGGMPSETRFARLRHVTMEGGRTLALVRCRLITGRMHQIRVHLAARGWPILGDRTYGVASPHIARQALHAWRIAFRHPVTSDAIEVIARPPGDMVSLLALLGAREIG